LGVQKIRVAHSSKPRLTNVLTQSFGSEPVPYFAHTRKSRGKRSRVRLQLFFRWRIVERAIDPHRPKQRIARVLFESLRRLRPTVVALIDVAKPAVVRPGRGSKADMGRNGARQRDDLRGWRGKRVGAKQIRLGQWKSKSTKRLTSK